VITPRSGDCCLSDQTQSLLCRNGRNSWRDAFDIERPWTCRRPPRRAPPSHTWTWTTTPERTSSTGENMFDDFESSEVDVGETSIFIRRAGTGPPLLLLHGFPQTHVMWRRVAPLLARQFAVVCADLRGYGRSGCPISQPDHAPHAKRALARDMVTLMEKLGFDQF